MNATDFHAELHALVKRAIEEGVAPKKIGFETAVGVVHGAIESMYAWRERRDFLAARAAAGTEPLIIHPGTGEAPAP